MNQTRWIVAVACVAFTLASARSGAETKSGFSLNPFAKSADSKKAASSSSKSSSGFKLPSLWPASEEKKVKKRPTEPSAWDKFTSGTQVDVRQDDGYAHLLGQRQGLQKAQLATISVRSRFGVKERREKKSFFSSWFSGEEDETQATQDRERVLEPGQAPA